MNNILYHFQNTPVFIEGDTIEKHQGNKILCLAHLVGQRILKWDASIDDADAWWAEYKCQGCPVHDSCALCMVNEERR